MWADTLVDRLNQAIFRYDDILTYLHGRGTTDDEIRRYRIGYSKVVGVPQGDDPELQHFRDASYNGRRLQEKLVFPFENPLGGVVGLFGRDIRTKEIKIFAFKETDVTGYFFGLPQALPHIYRTGRVFVVEGTFDQLAFAKVFSNCVASMTAGLNEAQYEFLRLFAKDIVLVFDHDNAGREAVAKAQKRWPEVHDLDIGYKDPSHALSVLSNRFESYIRDRVRRKFPF